MRRLLGIGAGTASLAAAAVALLACTPATDATDATAYTQRSDTFPSRDPPPLGGYPPQPIMAGGPYTQGPVPKDLCSAEWLKTLPPTIAPMAEQQCALPPEKRAFPFSGGSATPPLTPTATSPTTATSTPTSTPVPSSVPRP